MHRDIAAVLVFPLYGPSLGAVSEAQGGFERDTRGKERTYMAAAELLKQEINETMKSEHDLAKWKLIVVAGLGGAALGLGKDQPHYWLMLCIPFVCAYIDLHSYQYQARIMVLARFIREESHGDPTLKAYEELCKKCREGKAFYMGQYANLSASVGLSLLAPAFAVVPFLEPQRKMTPGAFLAIFLWLAGIALIVVLWNYHTRVIKRVNQIDVATHRAA